VTTTEPSAQRARVGEVETLSDLGRWLLVAGVAAAMVTPRIAIGGIHLGASDVLGVLGSGCWLTSWIIARTRSTPVGAARWPLLAVVAGVISLAASGDPKSSVVGIGELIGIWVLPTLAVAGLFDTDAWRRRLLAGVSVGALVAAATNVLTALRIGFHDGLPQVWGAADGWQGYYQVCALAIAAPALVDALGRGRMPAIVGWSGAIALHASALLLTQTRGAWVAAVAVAAVLGLVWRRAFAVSVGLLISIGILIALGTDWGSVVRERLLSVFHPEASLSGFDSSVIRAGLALTAVNMFLHHPLTGIGLKYFAAALPYYAPTGLPLAVEMGPEQVLIPIQGPHSTYLSLLSETGIVGAIAIIGWVTSSWLRALRWSRGQSRNMGRGRAYGASLCGVIAAVAVANMFSEMNASGSLPFVAFLALGGSLAAHNERR
jgi:O-antigen ligase